MQQTELFQTDRPVKTRRLTLSERIAALTPPKKEIFAYFMARYKRNLIKQGLDPREDVTTAMNDAVSEAERFDSVSEALTEYRTPQHHIHCHQSYTVYHTPKRGLL